MSDIELPFRTGRITIHTDCCRNCKSFACVKACSLFGTNILRIEDGMPSAIPPIEEIPRRCNECLACEHYCHEYGNGGLDIALPIDGLDECVTCSA